MCKGLGRLERFIFDRVLQQPVWLSCGALAKDAGVSGKSMARSMHSFVRKYPRYAVQGGIGRTHHLILYERSDSAPTVATIWSPTSDRIGPFATMDEVYQDRSRVTEFAHKSAITGKRFDSTTKN